MFAKYELAGTASRRTPRWAVVCMAAALGIMIGFSLPLVASRRALPTNRPKHVEVATDVGEPVGVSYIAVPTPDSAFAPTDTSQEVARLKTRNRRLEAMISVLRRRAEERSEAQ